MTLAISKFALCYQPIIALIVPSVDSVLIISITKIAEKGAVVNTLSTLFIYLYHLQAKYTQIEPLYQRARAICKQLGPNHDSTKTVRTNYAMLLRTMGRDTEANQLEGEP